MKKIISIIFIQIILLLLSGCQFLNFNNTIQVDTLNYISTVVMNSNLKIITNTVANFGLPGPYEGIGSGVIISKDDYNYYYVLTNNHVVDINHQYREVYNVQDVYNNKISAELIANDPAYDLAILKFYSDEEMEVMPLANNNPPKGQLVFSIGSPSGKQNIITAGKILDYQEISNVDYKVIIHDAVIRDGSSGSMLISDRYEIIGLNTWGFEKNENTKEYLGGATPTLKIREFLESINFVIDDNK